MKYSRKVTNMDEVVFTPASLLDLLSQIDELSEYPVGVSTTLDGNVQVTVGDSVYQVDCDLAEEVPVDENVVEQVSDINEDTYQEIVDEDEFEEVSVESGLIKEFVKTLAIGGLARLAGKAAKDALN